jgi:hypothetical protein
VAITADGDVIAAPAEQEPEMTGQETEMAEPGTRLTRETWRQLGEQAELARDHPETVMLPQAYGNADGWSSVVPPFGYPGLPGGWQLREAQHPAGPWYYTLVTPDGWQLCSHPQWQSPQAAAGAGLAKAIALAGRTGLDAIAAARKALDDGTVPVPDCDRITEVLELLVSAGADRRPERLALAGGLIALLLDERDAGSREEARLWPWARVGWPNTSTSALSPRTITRWPGTRRSSWAYSARVIHGPAGAVSITRWHSRTARCCWC